MYLRAISLLQRYLNKLKIVLWGSKGTIFVFHEVDTENRYGVEPSSFCTVEMFRMILNNHKGLFSSLDDFLLSSNGHKFVVTFDDVCESVYTKAYPLLCEFDVPFVLYLSPIGAHTMNHTKLRKEKDSFDDMYKSKIEVEAIVNLPVNHLAYPYGRADSVSHKVRKEAYKAGFKSATCTIPTEVPNIFDKWYIPRIAVW